MSVLQKSSSRLTSLRRSSLLGWRFLAITLVEPVYSARCVYQLLFSGKERVTSRADFHVQVSFACRARLKGLSTSAGYRYFSVFRVNSRFHYFFLSLSIAGPRPCTQTGYDRGVCLISSRRLTTKIHKTRICPWTGINCRTTLVVVNRWSKKRMSG